MPRIAIAGAGITGLAAAHRIQELARECGAGVDVAVYERSDRAGGCVRSVASGAALLELGADSLLIAKPAADSLIERLGLSPRIIPQQPEYRGARIVHDGRLRSIPPGFRLFAPRSIGALVRSGIFSPAGIARAALEPFVPPRRGTGDESLSQFVTRRLGREFLDRLAQPLIGGIYSADPARLSMQMALPQFLQYEREYGSLLRALGAAPKTAPPELVSLEGGLQTLIDALSVRLGNSVRSRRSVAAIVRTGDAWRIGFEDGSWESADAVILSTSAPVTASLLDDAEPGCAEILRTVRCNSIAAVNMVFDAAAIDLPPSTGFVVPFCEGRAIVAATFASQKYRGRAAADEQIVRVFFGGALQPEKVDESDEVLLQQAVAELKLLLGVRAAPKRSLVTRWRNVLPEYAVGHAVRIAQLERIVRGMPGIGLAGCAYRGVGIPDCIASGEAAAESVFGYVVGAKGAHT